MISWMITLQLIYFVDISGDTLMSSICWVSYLHLRMVINLLWEMYNICIVITLLLLVCKGSCILNIAIVSTGQSISLVYYYLLAWCQLGAMWLSSAFDLAHFLAALASSQRDHPSASSASRLVLSLKRASPVQANAFCFLPGPLSRSIGIQLARVIVFILASSQRERSSFNFLLCAWSLLFEGKSSTLNFWSKNMKVTLVPVLLHPVLVAVLYEECGFVCKKWRLWSKQKTKSRVLTTASVSHQYHAVCAIRIRKWQPGNEFAGIKILHLKSVLCCFEH